MPTDWDDVKRQLLSGKKRKVPDRSTDFLSTGSTLLNLALTGQVEQGFRKGHCYLWVGDSGSGKTFLCLTCLAEAANNQAFARYRLVFDNPERGALMDFQRYFGHQMTGRLEELSSRSLEDFYYNLDDTLKGKQPAIVVLDSMDALDAEDDLLKFAERKQAHRANKETSGSFGMAKAKLNTAGLRRANNNLKENGSILVIVSQTRDNVQAFSFKKKTRGGGRALTFYATVELWTSVRRELTKMVRGKKETVGVLCRIQVEKNRLSGRKPTIDLPIYNDTGIDDTGSLVAWLVDEKHWSKNGASVYAPEFAFKGHEEKLIQKIEEGDDVPKLKELVAHVWQEIDESCRVQRKLRYE